MMKEMNIFNTGAEQSNQDTGITLYHGSCDIIECPLYGRGKPDNDYGSGFYTTKLFDKAASWAVGMGEINKSIVNEYKIDLSELKVVNLKDYGVLAWIAEVASNRMIKSELAADFLPDFIDKYKPDTSAADIIVGYRADDSYTDVISAFVDGLLNSTEVQRLFYRGELGEQYFIKSPKAFNAIQFVKYTNVDGMNVREQLDSESQARQEVFKFLNQRRLAVAKRHYVPPITIIDALESDYHYNSEYDFYEQA